MNQAKTVLSMIIAALFLTGTLFLLGSCGSGKEKETEKAAVDKSSDFDGTWINYIGTVWVISGNSVKEYGYSTKEDAYLPSSEYYEKVYGAQMECAFTFEDGTLTQTVIEDGTAGGSFSMSLTVSGDKLTATVLDGRGVGTVTEYYRVDTPVNELKQLHLKSGFWYTEDRKYGLEVSDVSFGHFYNRGYFFEGSRADAEWSADMISIVALSNGDMMWANEKESGEGLNLPSTKRMTYTLTGDRLTIGGLDQIIVVKQGADGSAVYESCPVSELTFVYQGDQ